MEEADTPLGKGRRESSRPRGRNDLLWQLCLFFHGCFGKEGLLQPSHGLGRRGRGVSPEAGMACLDDTRL